MKCDKIALKESISSDENLNNFFIRRDLGHSTKKTYLIRIGKYCEFTQMTPTELILEAEAEEDQRKRMQNRKINNHLEDFKKHLRDMGKSYNTIKSYMAIVIGFYLNLILKHQG
jgi:hypothetical protein